MARFACLLLLFQMMTAPLPATAAESRMIGCCPVRIELAVERRPPARAVLEVTDIFTFRMPRSKRSSTWRRTSRLCGHARFGEDACRAGRTYSVTDITPDFVVGRAIEWVEVRTVGKRTVRYAFGRLTYRFGEPPPVVRAVFRGAAGT